jgi:hypothetical protein
MKFTIILTIAFIFIISNAQAFSACPSSLVVKLETGQSITFCEIDGLMVSKNCSDQKKSCSLLKNIKLVKHKIKDSNPLKKARTQNPGSFLCNEMKWKVLMGEVGDDGSQICTCQNNAGELIICTSLMDL